MPNVDQPNVLLITTDQQRHDCLQATSGNHQIWTPHLNWLADNGVAFTNAYSDCPVCLPARITLMTGRHAWHHGVMSNRWVEDCYQPDDGLAGRMGNAGYQTWQVGKNHYGPSRRHHMGFQTMIESEHYFRHASKFPELGRPRRTGHGQNEHVPGIDTVSDAHSLSAWTVDTAVDLIETRDPSRPFFGWISFDDPHPPFVPTRNWWDLYQGQAVPEAVYGNWSESIADVPPAFLGVTRELSQTQRLSPDQIAQAKRAYYALTSQIDGHLGLLFGRLRELSLLENTWIVFTSDHGEMLGDHHCGGKCVPFEGAARVPLIVKPPASPRDTTHPMRGQRSAALTCLADVMPSILSIAGVAAPADQDGIDLMAVARGETARSDLFGSCMYLHYLRRGRYKYCRESLDGSELCFDLVDDPNEQVDLIRAGQEPTELAAMRQAMNQHLAGLPEHTRQDPGVAQSTTAMPGNVHPGHRHPHGYR